MVAWMETQYDLNENGCWVWKNSKNKQGYGQVWWKGTMHLVHRVYWLLSDRVIPEGLEMCHGHGCSKACYNPEHLKPGTRVENSADRKRDGTDDRGEKNTRAKLTNEKVLAIRANPQNKSQTELSKVFGVTQSVISSIVNRKCWAHI